MTRQRVGNGKGIGMGERDALGRVGPRDDDDEPLATLSLLHCVNISF